MNTKIPASRLLTGLAFFVAFLPLTFIFSSDSSRMLMDTSYSYVVWVVQAIALFLLLLYKIKAERKQLIAMTILFFLIPFAFSFNDNEVSFLILKHYTSSILSWVIGIVLLSKLLFDTTFKSSH
ncbi:MAG: hypothetical protein M9898_14880 [Chitinophagaceae bacterium]|nr:hypothetical protein [Chitinophagaceae bacterium]MCW5914506.1 hypothetical protein [Chitinophagaceae bacterium]